MKCSAFHLFFSLSLAFSLARHHEIEISMQQILMEWIIVECLLIFRISNEKLLKYELIAIEIYQFAIVVFNDIFFR